MPIGRVIAVFNARPSQMPGSGCTTPNPDKVPRPTQPDQIATNAGNASTTTGHDRTGRTTATGTAAATSTGRIVSAAGLSVDRCSPDPETDGEGVVESAVEPAAVDDSATGG